MAYYYHVGDYKDNDYWGYAAITGFLWACLSQLGLGPMYWFYDQSNWGLAIDIGAHMLSWGMEVIFGLIFIWWGLAFTHYVDYGRIYFRVIQFLVPASWAVVLAANLCFIAGTIMKEDPVIITYPIIFDVFFFGIGAIIYFVLGEGNMHYYRWDEMNWWRYDSDDWFIIF